MLFRIVIAIGMTIFCLWHGIVVASIPSELGGHYFPIVYIVAPILLLGGLNPKGMITWPLATVLLLWRGHWIIGWIPLAFVLVNLFVNELFRRNLFRRMIIYVDVIKIAVYTKLRRKLENNYEHEEAGLLSAAVVNRVFGSTDTPTAIRLLASPDCRLTSPDSSKHITVQPEVIEKLAADYLQHERDEDVIRGIVMSWRTLMTIETHSRNKDAIDKISRTIQWAKSIITLPSDEPNPDTMEHLADLLDSRYTEQ